jgi:hypothetical protein
MVPVIETAGIIVGMNKNVEKLFGVLKVLGGDSICL